MNTVVVILILLSSLSGYSQLLLYQNTFQGGVSVVGMSTADAYGVQNFDINIPENSTVSSVFLVAYSRYSSSYEMDNYTFSINNTELSLNIESDFSVNVSNNIQPSPSPVVGHRIYVKEISKTLNTIGNNISINWMIPPENPSNPNCPSCRISAPYLIVLYENSTLPIVNISIILNENPNDFSGALILNGLNPINTSYDIGLGIHCDRVGGNPNDGYEFFINGTSIGILNETDASSLASGVIGTFEYYDGTLYGLTDDVPNDTFSGADAILRLNNYLTNNSLNGMQLTYNYLLPPNSPHNYFNTMCLVYTSPCQPFETTLLTSDTTTCVNSPVQLGVSVPNSINATYEWLPQTNLSCYDCPNPVFLGDSPTNYTVRIWSTDSCSVVMPVRVRVVPQPNFESINLTENICGFESGSIVGSSEGSVLPHTYQLNNGVPQNNFSFSNLSAGQYTLTVTDANGCSQDSTVQIIEINNVQAAFTINPSTGDAPLQVQTQNNSQNATQYQWFWEDQSSTLTNPSITLDTAGVYTLMLVAGNGATQCNDTASVMILVREPFEVFAYTFVTNEANVYQIYLSGVSEYKYDLYTLDGKLVYQKSAAVENAGFVDLWEIGGVASSVYLFRILVKADVSTSLDIPAEEVVEGKLVVVR